MDVGREVGRETIEEQRKRHKTEGERESQRHNIPCTLNKQLVHNKEIISVDGVVNCHF